MKNIAFFYLLFLASLSHNSAHAQVQVNLTIPNLGSPYLSDYLGQSSNQVLILSNTSGQRQEVFLRGKIEQLSSPGYYLRTKANYRPSAFIILEPFETKTLFANIGDFNFLDQSNLEDNVPVEIRRSIQLTGILPEGEYQICVQAFDFRSGAAVSGEEPLGCQFFQVTLGSPPQWVMPVCDDTLRSLYPVFQWTPAIMLGGIHQIQYHLYLVEYNSRALNPMEMMEQSIQYRAGNPIIIGPLKSNSYLYSPADIPLKHGSTYIGCVVASVAGANTLFENRGRSEICIFHVQDPGAILGGNPMVTGPGIVTQNPVINVGPGPFVQNPQIILNPNPWSGTLQAMFTNISGKLHHRFRYQQYDHVQTTHSIANTSPLPENILMLLENIDLSNNATGHSGNNTINVPNVQHFQGFSQNNQLSPENVQTGNAQSQGWQAYIGPDLEAYGIHGADKFFDENPYNQGSRALPFTQVSIVEQYFLIKNAIPSSMEDFIPVSGFTPLNFSLPFSLHDKTLATTTTDANGNFSFKLNQEHPCGIVVASGENGPININSLQLGRDKLDSRYLNVVDGRYIIRVLRIRVEDSRYFSPDIMMLPKPGSTVSTGIQTALIQSYRMKVNLISTARNGVLFDDKVPPMKASIVRRNADLPALQPGHPVFEPTSADNSNTVALSTFNMSGQGKVYYKASIDATPELWLRNLVAHRHGPANLYYLLLETDDNQSYNYKKKAVPFYVPPSDYLGNPVMVGGAVNSQFPRRAFNHQHVEPAVVINVNIEPDFPEIYLQTMHDGPPKEPLSGVALTISYPGTNFGATPGITDGNGIFRWKYPSMYGLDAIPVSLKLTHPGYFDHIYPTQSFAHMLKMGMRWPAPQEMLMTPKARVSLNVEDEDKLPTESYVKIGNGPIVKTNQKCTSSEILPTNNLLQFMGSEIPVTGSSTPEILNPGQLINFPAIGTNINYNIPSGTQLNNQIQGMSNEAIPGAGSTMAFLQNCKQVIEDMPAPSGNNVPITIEALATKYDKLETTRNINVFSGQSHNLGTFTVKYLKRKIYVRLRTSPTCDMPHASPDINTPGGGMMSCPEILTSTTIRLHNQFRYTTKLPHTAYFEFPNQGDQFRLRVDAGEDYIKIDTFIHVSHVADTLPVYIREGEKKSGRVIHKVTRQPVANARVYIQNGTNSYENVYTETFTNANGEFTLKGIDLTSSHSKLFAVKSDPDISYIGTEANLYPLHTFVEMEMETIDDWDLQKILGFKVEITKAIAQENDRLKLNGMLIDLPSNPNFKAEGSSIRIPFNDLLVKKHNSNIINSRPVPEPVSAAWTLEKITVPAIVNNKFLAVIRGVNQIPSSQGPGHMPQVAKLHIFKTNPTTGSLWGKAEILLSSFNFSNDFYSKFFLGQDSTDARVAVFNTQEFQMMTQREYYIGKSASNSFNLQSADYRIENFPAFASRAESKLRGDTFHLATKVIISVPEMNPSSMTIPMGSVKVTNNSTYVHYSGNSMQFKLDQWTVKCQNWVFDQTISSIRVQKATIQTSGIHVDINNLLLRPNQAPLSEGPLQISAGQATLSGVAPLQFTPGARLDLRYYVNQQSNGLKQYALQVSPPPNQPNAPACTVTLPDTILSGGLLGLHHLDIYSNNATHVNLHVNDSLEFFGVIHLKNASLDLFENSFHIRGNTHLRIPDLNTGMSATFKFTKPNNQIKAELIGMSIVLDNMKGEVFYASDNVSTSFHLSHGMLRAYGNLTVKENGTTRFTLRTRLEFTKDHCFIETFDANPQTGMPGQGATPQNIWLGNAANPSSGHIKVIEGKMSVVQNAWQYFIFKGKLSGSDATAGVKSGQDVLEFIVFGDINATAGQRVGVNDVNLDNTSNFTFHTYFDFGKSALIGDWQFTLPAPITIGNLTISGTIKGGFKFSPQGFYFYQTIGSASIQPIPGSLKAVFIIGSTTAGNIDGEARLSLNEGVWKKWMDLPPNLNRLDGFFMAANYTLIDFHLDINLFVVGLEIDIQVGTDLYAFATFGKTTKTGFGVLLYAGMKVDAFVFVCSLCLSLDLQFGMCGELGTAGAMISGFGAAVASGGICGATFSEQIKIQATLSSNTGLKVNFGGSDSQQKQCIPATRSSLKCGK